MAGRAIHVISAALNQEFKTSCMSYCKKNVMELSSHRLVVAEKGSDATKTVHFCFLWLGVGNKAENMD